MRFITQPTHPRFLHILVFISFLIRLQLDLQLTMWTTITQYKYHIELHMIQTVHVCFITQPTGPQFFTHYFIFKFKFLAIKLICHCQLLQNITQYKY